MPTCNCLSAETKPLPATTARDDQGRSWWRHLVHLPDRPGAAGGHWTSWTFAPIVSSVPEARHRAGETLRRWGLTDEEGTAELLVTEVITNAVAQTREPVRLRLSAADGLLRAEIEDRGVRRTVPRRTHLPDPAEESGRGLFLLDALACCWGVEYTATGKIVWFELPCHPSQRPGT